MDLKKTGSFFKELRGEKGLTQEQLAEHFGVSGRTVSRWETGSNMPDLDVLIEMADFYEVDLRELLDGERKSEKMNEELEETVLKVADYSNDEKMRIMRRMHIICWLGVVSFIVFMILEVMGLADSGVTEGIASFCLGLDFGILLVSVLYTSRHMSRIRAFKRKMLHRG